MTTIRSSTQSGLKIESDNSANIFFATGQSNVNLKIHSSGLVEIPQSSRLIVPVGNTAQRSSSSETGAIRLNTDTRSFEIFQGSFWTPLISGDPFYDDTILHITGDGGNNVNNDSYIDRGANSFVITKVGHPIQGSFNPYQTGWSVFLDNNGDFISNSSSTRFNFFTGGNYDYTVEGWIYQVGTRNIPNEGRDVIWDARTSDDGTGPVLAITGRTGQLEISANTLTNSSARNRSANVIIPNQWNHIAFVKQSNTYYYYINGQRDANTFVFTPFAGNTPRIGGTNVASAAEGGNASSFHGFISNFRVTRTAVYANSFTVPTAPLTALPNTVILTCQDPYGQDNSSFRNTLVLNGEASVVPFSPFGRSNVRYNPTAGGSAYLSGTGDYFTVADNPAFEIPGDFTVEAFFYCLSLPATGLFSVIISKGAAGVFQPYYIFINDTGNILFYSSSNGSSWNVASEVSFGTVKLRRWHHIAVSRVGANLRLFLDGSLITTITNSAALYDNTRAVAIGARSDGTEDKFVGWISSVRLVKGTGVYTSNFTPPTNSLTNIANTSLLLNFENAGIYDSRQINNMETIGDVKIVTSSSPSYFYGNSAVSFNGNSFLSFPIKSDQRFYTNPFTIESWIYRNNSNTHTIFDMGNTLLGEGLQLSVIDDLLVLNEGWANVSIASTVPGSVRFAGRTTDDYVEYDSNVVARPYKFGSNNFTIEYWIYPERAANDGHMSVWQAGGAWHISHYANLSISFLQQTTSSTSSTRATGTGIATLTANTWNHVAIAKQWPENGSKTSGNLRIFINGLLQGANTNHSSAVEYQSNSVKPLRLGVGPDKSQPFQGRIADVRITNGECLYTANFTVPSSPLTILNANTIFLSCQHGLEDASRFQTPLFVPRLSISRGNVLITRDTPYNANNFTTRVATNTWVHVAAVRSSNLGNQTSLYINGRRVANGTLRINFFNANTTIMIGENQLQANGFSGHIKDFRITKDARYTADFTPPAKMPDRNS
jgi:hypothetical protein